MVQQTITRRQYQFRARQKRRQDQLSARFITTLSGNGPHITFYRADAKEAILYGP
jgi:hypothetical protein